MLGVVTTKDTAYISLQNAVNMHNGYRTLSPIGNVSVQYLEAFNNTLIEQCYIQRKDSGFHLQQKQIQLTEKGREYVLESKCGSNYQWLVDALKEQEEN